MNRPKVITFCAFVGLVALLSSKFAHVAGVEAWIVGGSILGAVAGVFIGINIEMT